MFEGSKFFGLCRDFDIFGGNLGKQDREVSEILVLFVCGDKKLEN
jgi:hypothetical protein